jgi:hypothetical protein
MVNGTMSLGQTPQYELLPLFINASLEPKKFPCCFEIKAGSLLEGDFPVKDVSRLCDDAGFQINFAGQGWTKIDSPKAKRLVEDLIARIFKPCV